MITFFLSSLSPNLLPLSLSNPFINHVNNTISIYSFSPPLLIILIYSFTHPSIQLSLPPPLLPPLSSPEGSAPPQPRRLPGDGGQQEAGGQRCRPRRQQRLHQLHDIQRHGALLCPAAPRTPSILQRLSLFTQPNRHHGQGAAAKWSVTHSRRLPTHEGEELGPGLRRLSATRTAAGLPGSHPGLPGEIQRGRHAATTLSRIF